MPRFSGTTLLAVAYLCLARNTGTAKVSSNVTSSTYYNHPNSVYYDRNTLDEVQPMADRQVNDSRLPINVLPEKYSIWLVPHLDDDSFLLEGSVAITVKASSDTSNITLHVDDMDVSGVSVTDVSEQTDATLTVLYWDVDADRNFLVIAANESLLTGRQYVLRINYTGHLREGMNGFYRSHYYRDGEIRWLAATQFSATAARKAFPCFDEPAFKAKFQINIGRDPERHSLSNMPIEYSNNSTANLTWDHFEETPMPMSTYLVAFVVSDFVNATSSDGVFSTWQRSDALHQANYSVSVSPDTLAVLENLTGLPYFLPKMDQVAVPDFAAGAMENWGLILYRERNLLFEEGSSTVSNKQRIAEVISHELAHMWFGNLVTPEWWSYLWLSEGFATYFQYFAMNQVEPDMRLAEQFVLLQLHSALQTDSLPSTHPMTKEVSSTEIGTLISQIVYNKAASVLRMAQHFLTTKVFYAGLNRYLVQNANDTAVPDDLFSALQEVYTQQYEGDKVDVVQVMRSWTLQPGYPVLYVNRDYSADSATISQKRFFLWSDEAASNNTDYKWWIPITYTSQQSIDFNNTVPHTWLNSTEAEKNISSLGASRNQWIIFNIQETGFYRVNYDAENWRLLSDYLDSEYYGEVHVLNRAQLLDDALNLARAGQLDYSLALSLTRYLSRETDYIAWYPAFNALSYLDQRLRGLGEYPHHVFKMYILKLLDPLYQSLGFEERNSDDHVTKLLRNLVLTWECNYGQKDCISKSVDLFHSYMNNTTGFSVPPDVRSVVYCEGLRQGGEQEWQFLWDRLMDTRLSTEEGLIMTALGCSRSETLVHRYLEKTLDSNSSIRSQDVSSIFPAVLSQPMGVDFAISFIEGNYQRIIEHDNSMSSITSLVSQIANYVTSGGQLQKLTDVIANITRDIGPNTLLNNLQTAEINQQWLQTHGNTVSTWLKQQDYRLPTNIVPEYYYIVLKPDLDNGTFQFEGRVNITFSVASNTDRITLHAYDLDIEEDTISVGVDVSAVTVDTVRQFYDIKLEEELVAGWRYRLHMFYKGYHREDMEGFYRSYYYRNGTKRWLASTQFQPTGARRAFPCFDEPALKAQFKVTIGRTDDRHVLTNMPLDYTIKDDFENVTWDVFKETPMPISTYLIAFVVSDFENLSSSDDFYKTWQRPNAVHQARYSIDVSPALMSSLENFTSLDYFLPKMDHVAVPDFSAGAMENWGLVTYREQLILVEEGVATSADRQNVATVIAHEFAHMWFGNLVSPKWWSFTWLSEGFARYFEFFTTHSVETLWRLDDQFVVRQVQSSLLADSLQTANPLTFEVGSPASIENMFNIITYNKGASVIRMMEHFMSSGTFRRGIGRYLSYHGMGTAEPSDLFSSLDEQYLQDFPDRTVSVAEVMSTWTLQSGYPVLTVARDYTTSTVTVSQERFLLQKSASEDDRKWWVPLTYTSQSEMNFWNTTTRHWLNTSEPAAVITDLSSSDTEWIIFNIQEIGFYRVNYDSRNWELISQYLDSDSYKNIHLLNRAQLLDDAFNLARAGVISYPVALRLSRYLSREVDYIPWLSALTSFNFLDTRLRGLSQDEHAVFQSYVLGLLEEVYQEVGLQENSTDSHHAKLHRSQILTWLCRYGERNCVNMAKWHFSRLMADPSNYLVPPDLKSVVYCNGLRHGGEEEFSFLWDRYLNHNANSEQVLILGAMGCTTNESLAHRYLRMIITEDSGIRSHDESTVTRSVLNNHYGVDFAISYLNSSFQDILEFHNSTVGVMSLISSISAAVSSHEQLDKLRAIVEVHKELLGPSVTSAFSSAENNLAWLSNHGTTIVSWLQEQSYRLPSALIPDAYVIRLAPNLTTFTFDGEVAITLTTVEDTDRVLLHANDLSVDLAGISLVTLGSVSSVVISDVAEDSLRHFLVIRLNQSLVAGEQYDLHINYTGHMRDDMFGFYRSYYYQNGQRRWIGSTQFQPTHARRAFPCFDEPAFKARFNMSILVPAGYHALFNTRKLPTDDSELLADGRRWERFEETPVMSTYLVAFVVSDFVERANDVGNVSVWQRSDAAAQAQYALGVTQPIVSAMERLVGHGYQLSKLDQAAIPDFSAGAMENWGLVTYRERLILWDEEVSTTADRMNIATVISHEVAHKWFGNLVTLSWWTYTWLNEGFATYFETFATAEVETEWRLGELFVILNNQAAMASDARETSRPMTHSVSSPTQIWSVFDFVSYIKAGSVLRMMEHFLTHDVFLRGLSNYLEKHGYGNVDPDDLYAVMQNASSLTDVSVKAVMDTWANQMGYPLITVTRNYTTGTVSVEQERFLLHRSVSSSDYNDYKWWVPLSYTNKTAANFANTAPSSWLPADSSVITISSAADSDDWLIFNLQETGYYRVNYDARNWNLLIEQLRSDQFRMIPAVSRAQLLDDSMNLARAGILQYDVALDLTTYLSRETDYIPWYSALTAFTFLDTRLRGAATQDYQRFTSYILNMTEDIYNSLGFTEGQADGHTTKLLRALILGWACNHGVESCVTWARQELSKQMSNTSYRILPDVSRVVYCTALKHGGVDEWNHLWQRYLASNVGTEQVLLLNVLGCTVDEGTINRYLSLSISENSGIRSQDAASVFVAVYSHPVGLSIAFDFLVNNYRNISAFYGGMNSIGSILTGIAAQLSTREQVDTLRQFVREHEDNLGTALDSSRRALESAEENLAWAATHGQAIFDWLSESSTPSSSSTAAAPSPTASAQTTPQGGAGSTFSLSAVLACVPLVSLLLRLQTP